MVLFFIYLKKLCPHPRTYYSLLLERGKGRERSTDWLSHMCLDWDPLDPTPGPGIKPSIYVHVPDWELYLSLFGDEMTLQLTEPHQPGLLVVDRKLFLSLLLHSVMYIFPTCKILCKIVSLYMLNSTFPSDPRRLLMKMSGKHPVNMFFAVFPWCKCNLGVSSNLPMIDIQFPKKKSLDDKKGSISGKKLLWLYRLVIRI